MMSSAYLKEIDVADVSLDDMRRFIGRYLTGGPDADKLWDIMTALRGPDSPSEDSQQDSKTYSEAYRGRRERKYAGVEIIRQHAFFGAMGGGARHHNDDKVVLLNGTDHHDRHLARAAAVLGLKVERRK
jgi:hypothetical protein